VTNGKTGIRGMKRAVAVVAGDGAEVAAGGMALVPGVMLEAEAPA
jgi:hypothetical protein